ncbi:hypothetical protein BMS3Bbin04_00852 [bacterium BMS3Bbin04]|nr:hypothetical protein BMS3Bbin04_00852 [bacterium BMS3Bbin04]
MCLATGGDTSIQLAFTTELVQRGVPADTVITVNNADLLTSDIEHCQREQVFVEGAVILGFEVLLITQEGNLGDFAHVDLVFTCRSSRTGDHRSFARGLVEAGLTG